MEEVIEVLPFLYIDEEFFGYDVHYRDGSVMNSDWGLLAKFSCIKENGHYLIRKALIKEKRVNVLSKGIIGIKNADRRLYEEVRRFVGERDYSDFSTCHALFSHEQVSTGF